MQSRRQAVFFGNFVNNFFNEVPIYAENNIIKELGLKFGWNIASDNIQITPNGAFASNIPVLITEDKGFLVRFNYNRIDIEEAIISDTEDTKQFIEKVLCIYKFLSEEQKIPFGRIALNGDVILDLSADKLHEYYLKMSKFPNLINANESEWIFGETKQKSINNEIITIKYSISQRLFTRISETGIPEEKSLLNISYDINTTYKNLLPRFNYSNSQNFFGKFEEYKNLIMKGVLSVN